MSIWWVHSQSAGQPFFGSVALQTSFSLSCTYALEEWSVVSHHWSRRTPARFCIWSSYFTERGRWNWTFTKSELLLHRHEATAPALAKALCYIYALFMEDACVFCSKDTEPSIFSLLTMSLLSSKSMYFLKPHASQQGCLGWWMSFWFCQGSRSEHHLLKAARRFAENNIKTLFQEKVDFSFPNYDQYRANYHPRSA